MRFPIYVSVKNFGSAMQFLRDADGKFAAQMMPHDDAEKAEELARAANGGALRSVDEVVIEDRLQEWRLERSRLATELFERGDDQQLQDAYERAAAAVKALEEELALRRTLDARGGEVQNVPGGLTAGFYFYRHPYRHGVGGEDWTPRFSPVYLGPDPEREEAGLLVWQLGEEEAVPLAEFLEPDGRWWPINLPGTSSNSPDARREALKQP